MKLTKKNIIWSAITIIIIASILLFLIFNFNLFRYKKDFFKNSEVACQNLNINDSCSFIVKDKKISGQCQYFRNNTLLCRPKPSK